MDAPPNQPVVIEEDEWGGGGWIDRDRRQRTIRLLLMFLVLLLLMDSEETEKRQQQNNARSRKSMNSSFHMESEVFNARIRQDELIFQNIEHHPRYLDLFEMNDKEHVDQTIKKWLERVPTNGTSATEPSPKQSDDTVATHNVFHYPWNVTGFYRGTWSLTEEGTEAHSKPSRTKESGSSLLNAKTLEEVALNALREAKMSVGMVVLPDDLRIEMRDDNNLTTLQWESLKLDSKNKLIREAVDDQSIQSTDEKVPLTNDWGRLAFQFYSRPVPAMQELSLVDGFIKLCNSEDQGYSSKVDVLLRVRGVIIHPIGKLSLVSNVDVDRSVFAMERDNEDVRKLRDSEMTTTGVVSVTMPKPDETTRRNETNYLPHTTFPHASRVSQTEFVVPFPFVIDDATETIRRTKTPGSRQMPTTERALETNAAGCKFEIDLDVGVEQWSFDRWRALLSRKATERRTLGPSPPALVDKGPMVLGLRGSRPKPVEDEAFVMSLQGTIVSKNCGFMASINATSQRTDWEATTSKAINYSFLMMLVCLSQILVLLRQLLHSQGQAAVRVSLICIGWQTLIDALLCLAHIYMSLSMPPLFSAFASVSFFKLLIFCVIEMKYMALIVQARNNNSNNTNGAQTLERLRRQIALLHIRFYTAMVGSFILLLYVGNSFRSVLVLLQYSFWIPQIILNIATEARNPMHNSYIYGMSLTRLFAPVYVLAVKDNFLREVYPDAPYDTFLVQVLLLWVGIQTFLLVGQNKYGARFMIPARFLPPKFDYSRPLPASLLPPGSGLEISNEDEDDQVPEVNNSTDIASPIGRHSTTATTRNRMRGNRLSLSTRSGKDAVPQRNCSTAPLFVALECSICYDAIDPRKRHDYMLAPCNHLYHRQCLVNWMDVKMECPICRTELPAL